MRTPDYAAKAVELLEEARKTSSTYSGSYQEAKRDAAENMVKAAEVYAYLHRTLLEADRRA